MLNVVDARLVEIRRLCQEFLAGRSSITSFVNNVNTEDSKNKYKVAYIED